MPSESLRSGFLESALSRPGATALVVGDQAISYGELEQEARRWAQAILNTLGSRPGRIAIFAYRSRTAYAGTLAALFAGATFVPLNRTFPVARTRTMLEAAAVDAIILDQASAGQMAGILAESGLAPLIVLPEAGELPASLSGRRSLLAPDLQRISAGGDLPEVSHDDEAYLLFTSGSTGLPKGVPVSHGNVTQFLDVASRRYDFSPEDRFSQTFDQTFDLSIFDMFMAWEYGACVCVPQALELLAPSVFVTRHRLTVWFSVPSVPALMMRKQLLKPGILPSLRWSLFCGEPLPQRTAEEWQAAAPASIVENLYGPTEATVACFAYRWDPVVSPRECVGGVVPIGTPFPDLEVRVLDELEQPVRTGEAGELCFTGPQVFRGYWRDESRTREKFVRLAAEGGRTFYRTGDRVRALSNGNLVYLGRTDHQVKVLGHRVELGEIEAALLGHEGVVQAVAVGWPFESGSYQGIVAFASGHRLDTATLLDRARRLLPSYMVPARIIQIEEMPLNANGKVDRIALVKTHLEKAGLVS